MHHSEKQQLLLRTLPGVDHIIEQINARGLFKNTPKSVVMQAIRRVIDALRREILSGSGETATESLGDGVVLAPGNSFDQFLDSRRPFWRQRICTAS
jgi:hypothetical protein